MKLVLAGESVPRVKEGVVEPYELGPAGLAMFGIVDERGFENEM